MAASFRTWRQFDVIWPKANFSFASLHLGICAMTPLDGIVRDCGVDPTRITMPSYQRTPDRPTYLTSVLRPGAYEIWGKLRESLPPMGYWPALGWDIFVRPPAQWDYPAPDDTIAEGLGFDLDSWLRDEGGSVTSIAGYYPILRPHCSESPFRYDVVKTDQHVTGDVNQGQTEVPLALVPVDVTWKVPAYL
jgi:hypothetical protein